MEQYTLAKRSAYAEGESTAKDLVTSLADVITKAQIPNNNGDGTFTTNKWTEVYRESGAIFVEYEKVVTDKTAGLYKHTDNNTYKIYGISLSGIAADRVTAEGELREVVDMEAAETIGIGQPTGLVIDLSQEVIFTDPNGVSTTVNTYTEPVLLAFTPNKDKTYGYDTHVLIQGYTDDEGNFVYDPQWDDFVKVATLANDDISFFADAARRLLVYSYNSSSIGDKRETVGQEGVLKAYTFSKVSYKAKPIVPVPKRVVLSATPDVPEGINARTFHVMFEQRMDDFAYMDISYGTGFEVVSAPVGDPFKTYEGICDPLSFSKEGDVPKIIDMLAVHLYVAGPAAYTPSVLRWTKDIDGKTELRSPKSHFFHSRKASTEWVLRKERRADYNIRYWLSVNNDRVAVVIEGDPAPSIKDYYRSFAYIGKIVPFNQYDHAGNFGVTVGMGDLKPELSNFSLEDVDEKNENYGIWGEYSSNGMYSMSMYNTRSDVFFQAHYPAFLTQLPNYPSVGTLPVKLKRLVLGTDGFQASIWSNKYHGSPIYITHLAEGYRGFLDGVVAVADHHIITGDELIVDTEILKDPNDASKGTWEEVYKFLSITAPVSFFTKSAAPGTMSVAILKEIR